MSPFNGLLALTMMMAAFVITMALIMALIMTMAFVITMALIMVLTKKLRSFIQTFPVGRLHFCRGENMSPYDK